MVTLLTRWLAGTHLSISVVWRNVKCQHFVLAIDRRHPDTRCTSCRWHEDTWWDNFRINRMSVIYFHFFCKQCEMRGKMKSKWNQWINIYQKTSYVFVISARSGIHLSEKKKREAKAFSQTSQLAWFSIFEPLSARNLPRFAMRMHYLLMSGTFGQFLGHSLCSSVQFQGWNITWCSDLLTYFCTALFYWFSSFLLSLGFLLLHIQSSCDTSGLYIAAPSTWLLLCPAAGHPTTTAWIRRANIWMVL